MTLIKTYMSCVGFFMDGFMGGMCPCLRLKLVFVKRLILCGRLDASLSSMRSLWFRRTHALQISRRFWLTSLIPKIARSLISVHLGVKCIESPHETHRNTASRAVMGFVHVLQQFFGFDGSTRLGIYLLML